MASAGIRPPTAILNRHRSVTSSSPMVCRRNVATCALKLYTSPRSRGAVVEWYLKEVNADYEPVVLDLANKEHKSDWYLKVNPMGKVPALEDDGFKLFESGAILEYLAETVGGADTPAKRAEVSKWIYFANASLVNVLFIPTQRETQLAPCMDALSSALEGRDYLCGEFSAADAAVGSTLIWATMMVPNLDLSPWPRVSAYVKRLIDRPACTVKPEPVPASESS